VEDVRDLMYKAPDAQWRLAHAHLNLVDSCCGGGAPIETTAKRDGIDVETLVKALNAAVRAAEGAGARSGGPEGKNI